MAHYVTGHFRSAPDVRCADSAPRRPTISVIIITRNEQERLERTLESVAWADEIVIVDSGSTDRTEEIARRYTERFFVMPWEGYGVQKQRALERATGDWVLSIDADEAVSPQLRRSIEQSVLQPGGVAGFRMELHTEFLGAWLGSRGWHRERKMRLFRRDLARFDASIVHEGISLAGTVADLEGVLLHYHYRGFAHQIEKLNSYSSLMAERQYAGGKRVGITASVTHGAAGFLKSFVLQGRFLHGRAGFAYAAFSGMYGFMKYLKLWELRRSGPPQQGGRRGSAPRRPASPRDQAPS
jgi:glycosyltransferase involved in cell wall biosynthesis